MVPQRIRKPSEQTSTLATGHLLNLRKNSMEGHFDISGNLQSGRASICPLECHQEAVIAAFVRLEDYENYQVVFVPKEFQKAPLTLTISQNGCFGGTIFINGSFKVDQAYSWRGAGWRAKLNPKKN